MAITVGFLQMAENTKQLKSMVGTIHTTPIKMV